MKRKNHNGTPGEKKRKELLMDECARAMLYHLRHGSSDINLALRYAADLDKRNKVQMVFRELLLFSYTHIGLANINMPEYVLLQYRKWFETAMTYSKTNECDEVEKGEEGEGEEGEGETMEEKTKKLCNKVLLEKEGQSSGYDEKCRLFYLSTVFMCCVAGKSVVLSHYAKAYLLASTGCIDAETWRQKLCPGRQAVPCILSIRDGCSSAIKKCSTALFNAIIGRNEVMASKMVDLMCGWGQTMLLWDILFVICGHVQWLNLYERHLSVNLISWLILTDEIDEYMDIFIPWMVGEHEHERTMIFGGSQFVPQHRQQHSVACKSLLTDRFSLDKRPKKMKKKMVLCRPVIYHTVLMLCRMLPPVNEDMNIMQIIDSTQKNYGKNNFSIVYDDPPPSPPNHALDVYTRTGRAYNRGAVHLWQQESRVFPIVPIYGDFEEMIQHGYSIEEKDWGKIKATDPYIAERKNYETGKKGTHPDKKLRQI